MEEKEYKTELIDKKDDGPSCDTYYLAFTFYPFYNSKDLSFR